MAAWEIRNLYKGKGKAGKGERRIRKKKSRKKRKHSRDISIEISSSLIFSLFSVSVEIYHVWQLLSLRVRSEQFSNYQQPKVPPKSLVIPSKVWWAGYPLPAMAGTLSCHWPAIFLLSVLTDEPDYQLRPTLLLLVWTRKIATELKENSRKSNWREVKNVNRFSWKFACKAYCLHIPLHPEVWKHIPG